MNSVCENCRSDGSDGVDIPDDESAVGDDDTVTEPIGF